ncbi:hypothetical protein JHK86_023214 [Glycine max]|nr:hypothetical protein JHK86_023214 [Glycine max]
MVADDDEKSLLPFEFQKNKLEQDTWTNPQAPSYLLKSTVKSLNTPSNFDPGKAMGFLKAIFVIAITMALSIALTMKTITHQEEAKPAFVHHDFPSSSSTPHDQKNNNVHLPSKRVSRFLAQVKNPNAADHCHKDHEVCTLVGAKNSTCCNNKCIDVGYDYHNCGACKMKCKLTDACCRGECVNTNFDKRHCGECNHRCEVGAYCVYGMCGYA